MNRELTLFVYDDLHSFSRKTNQRLREMDFPYKDDDASSNRYFICSDESLEIFIEKSECYHQSF